MADSYLGESIKKLGFGLMRLPMIGEEIDMEQTKRMVDTFMEKGFTYFDTAYVYIGGKSEVALKEAVVDRYPRDSFQCATKLPLWDLKEPQEMEKIFQESLDRAGLEYYDFYLLHAMSAERVAKADELGAWDFMKRLKAEGRAKHIGFSFHDTAEALEDILKAHPEMEFVQLQINYADWEDDSVQSRKCYEVARKYGKPVIIMEPVKGGLLADPPQSVAKVLRDAAPNKNLPSWALRFAASLEGVITVLSGMSTLGQMEENLETMKHFAPLDPQELEVIGKAREALAAVPSIPCTSCQYCMKGCPQGIPIPSVFSAMNTNLIYGNLERAKGNYGFAVRGKGKASDCVQCGQCESVCPQHISIIEELQKAAAALE